MGIKKPVHKICDLLAGHFIRSSLGVAGQLVYLDGDTFILGIHTTSPEKVEEISNLAWDGLPNELKIILEEYEMGFAVKMI